MKRRDVLAAIGGAGSIAACVAASLLRRDRYGRGSSSMTGWRRFDHRSTYSSVVHSSSQWDEDVAVFGFPPSAAEIAGLFDRGCVRFMFVDHVISGSLSVLLSTARPVILLAFQNVTFANEVIDNKLDLPDIRQLWIEGCTISAESVVNLIWTSHSSIRSLRIISGPSPAAILPPLMRCKNLEYLELKNVGLKEPDINALRRLPRLATFSYGEPPGNLLAPSIKYVRQVLRGVDVDDNCC